MIRSMTGFGDAACEVDGIHYAVELRSLNNRFFKCSARLPEDLAGLEAEVETALRKRFARGSFAVAVKMRLAGEAAASKVNDVALMGYLEHLESVKGKLSDQAVTIDLTHLLALPGVMEPATDPEAILARSRPVILNLLKQASDKLDAMRKHEGEALATELLSLGKCLRDTAGEVAERAPQVIDEYHNKLTQRVGELMAKAELTVSQNDLIREVAVYADRCDIREEIARLNGHLDQFEQIINREDGEPAGRTLDFLTQEMLREANTMGSKSNDASISRRVVEAKSLVDRLKEQVQNVE
jgi:uncharacterized protein (TIGR00255 family)